ncbi:uncharacterized protein GGS25DRAFT_520107 [Hypoxylon fragiforme]|uniref:uncharacterized protein n=1 Tax=Hypoxylon fragiforme TaxID=63214 RepID=UPI0020C5FB6A|nr:uncharacterized protein GGS25DRAFT_520107 [Hypoxylon fragiforme]KAI2609312.1 hypothetical protein GGS25DRAFT_520107 [Hypoxylon fragiforme]
MSVEIRIPFPKDRDFVLAYECQGTTLDSTRANTQKYGSNNYSRQTSPNISNAHSPHTDLSIRYDAGITISDVKEFLSPRLPEYMVPTDLEIAQGYARIVAGDNESRRVEFEDFDFNLQQGGIDSVQIISLSMFLGRRYGVQDPTVEILSLKPTVSTIAVIVDVNQSQHNCSENSQTISVQDEVDAQIKSITLTLTTGPLLLGAHDHVKKMLNSDCEMVVSNLCHEASAGAWGSLAKYFNIAINWWSPPPGDDPYLSLETSKPLLTPKTRVVTCNHVSNVVGQSILSDKSQIWSTVFMAPF